MCFNKFLSSSLLISIILFSACSNNAKIQNDVTINKPLTIELKSIATPMSDADKKKILSASDINVSGKNYDVSYKEIIRTGYKDNGEIYGAVKDVDGKPIKFKDGSPYICNGTNNGSGSGLDFSSILNKDSKIYLVSQFECSIGAMYMLELEQDKDGDMKPKKNTLQYIPQGKHGGWTHCAGSVTPWNSHLGSEEYETNAFEFEKNNVDVYFQELKHFFKEKYTSASPYFYGWVPEVQIHNSVASYEKHYSMGRFSHEIAYVMPDEKTVYMSDDGKNTGLFMFMADKKGDLSSGTLYAAKFKQIDSFNGGNFDLTWINLGHSSDAAMKLIVDSTPKFSDIFDISEPIDSATCQKGFTSIHTSFGQECLRVKNTKEEIASRLETRRYAAIKGATTELNKEEGIDYDPMRNRLYIAITSVSNAMEDANKRDIGGNNDIRLPHNDAGAVYALDLAIDNAIGTNFLATNFYSIVAGENKDYIGTKFEGNEANVDKIANPDNLTFIQNSNTLIIAEDSYLHANNIMWTYDVVTEKLERFATLPRGSEATSTSFYRNLNGYSYLSLVIQHPTDDKESSFGLFKISSDLVKDLIVPTSKAVCEAKALYWNGHLCYEVLPKADYSKPRK